MSDIASKIKIGPGLDPSTELGPLVSEEQFDRVSGFLTSGREQGAKFGAGGQRSGDRGYFIQPTVLSNVKPGMKVVDEEIFGPVVVAQSFSSDADLDRLAAQANDSIYGLAASVWTRDISSAHKMARRIKAGTVWINCHNVFDAALPFGGYKQSGWGREMGAEVLNNYTEVKAVTIKL
jgi:phenylacetaldehyde dehydrogenase